MCRIIPNGQTFRENRTITRVDPHDPTAGERRSLEAHVMARYDELMASVSAGHAPEFVSLDVTMAQMKALYLVAARGSLHVSALAELLGVTLSTGSGLADRLVDQGLLERRHHEADRRHVVLSLTAEGSDLLERMRELNSRRVRSMLGAIDDADLAALGRVLTSFIEQVHAESAGLPTPRIPRTPAAPPQEGAR